jgi:tRNA pseudouridine55 synthase
MRGNRTLSDNKKPIEGILVVDKPQGISSYDVIRVIKRSLSPRKIGHTGTLDPLASGVLPIVINGATKVVPFLDEGVKCYEGTLKLGTVTDSDDSTGRVLRETSLDRPALTEDRIQGVSSRFLGKVKQVPPMFSAIKYRGRPMYTLARRGIEVARQEREVEIFSLKITAIDLPFVDFKLSCSRGTYVRTLSRQIGDALGLGAHLCRLRRTKSGPFSLKNSVTLSEFDELIERGEIQERIMPLREALGNMPEIEIGVALGDRIKRGHQVYPKDLRGLRVPSLERDQRVKILHRGEIVAIARAQRRSGDHRAQSHETPALSLLRVLA